LGWAHNFADLLIGTGFFFVAAGHDQKRGAAKLYAIPVFNKLQFPLFFFKIRPALLTCPRDE
jgi:hypothetical protein